MTLRKSILPLLGTLGILVLFVYLLSTYPGKVTASVPLFNEYIATTTSVSATYGATVTGSRAVRTVPGTFGSLVITGANTGIVNFYDATTSDINKRTGQTATSSILLATIPASLVAGTYTFDVAFNQGLFIDLISGNMPTSTVTYR